MTRLYLVRHGRATAGWNVDPDPGLDAIGVAQAANVAEKLQQLGSLPIVSSPLRRCRETAAALSLLTGQQMMIEPAVAEIPSPDGIDMADRVEWLRTAMAGTWAALGVPYTSFGDGVGRFLCSLNQNTVIFTHFVAINAAIGHALGDDRVLIRSLDNCSITTFDVIGSMLELVEGGHEADTLIR